MSLSTQGMVWKFSSRRVRAAVELLSSMRFSIALLTLICIASVIGTVLKQNEPFGNYVNQFGPFWADIFGRLGLYGVYSAWWFLTILGFLVLSTSLCLARNIPKILVDLRTYKEHIRVQSLQAFGQRGQATLDEPAQGAAVRVQRWLLQSGWKVRVQERQTPTGPGWMLAAKAGAANKLGYIAAHSAIVLICIGGLLDGDWMVRAQMWLHDKTPYRSGGMLADVPAQHRLDEGNPTFRANLLVAEGTQSSTAVLNQSDGVLLQELPFAVELTKFVVEFYSTGMPKLFASDIVIHDKATGAAQTARVEVNHPVRYRGIDIYQSSFDDGGSQVSLDVLPLDAPAVPSAALTLQGTVGGSSQLRHASTAQPAGASEWTVEYTGLRVINVENLSAGGAAGATDVRGVDLRATLDASLGAANKTLDKKDLRNVGPSMSYKLRDAAGQAREFNNYMLPVDLGDGVPVFLLGMRDTPAQAFRYWRVPADASGRLDGFMRLRYALLDGNLRRRAVERYAKNALPAEKAALQQQLAASAERALAVFASGAAQPGSGAVGSGAATPGLQALSDFVEANVPAAEREKASDVLVRMLNGTLWELAQLAQAKAGLPPLGADANSQAFMTQSVLALSDLPLYTAPVLLVPKDFTQVQASVFQVARAPGRGVVYAGCAFLILGIFAMLYVRERRLWVWFAPLADAPPGSAVCTATMALSSNRKTLDGAREFEQLQAHILGTTDRKDLGHA